MSEDTRIILFTLGAFIAGLCIGALIDGAMWRMDCAAIGAHQTAERVYDCKPRAK